MSEVNTANAPAEGTAAPNAQAAPTPSDTLYTEAKVSEPSAATPAEKPQEAAPKAEESKQNEAQEKPAAPEKYELKIPDGSLLDAKAVEGIASFAKDQGLSQAQAEKLLMREHEAMSRFVESQNEQIRVQHESWKNSVKQDPEIGGDSFNKSVEAAKRVVTRFGSEAFIKQLTDTGLGNHPELVRFCARIGRAMLNDDFVKPGAQASTKKSAEEVLYGASR